MCIRDRDCKFDGLADFHDDPQGSSGVIDGRLSSVDLNDLCLLYTSDAADERSSVDLGGRRIIKKKKTSTNT